eukprot:8627438-Alexandrium_andersonii.AAC.1
MLEVGGLPEGFDDGIEFNWTISRLLPEFAYDALRFIQFPKKLIDDNDPEQGVRGRRVGRLIFREESEEHLDLQAIIEALRDQKIRGKVVYGYRIPNPFDADADRGARLGVDSE